jgi:hypothetical protein
MQTGSSEYLERDAEQTLWKEFATFDAPIRRDSSAMKPRVDSESFTFIAWVSSDDAMETSYIVRKPLTAAGQSQYSSCWSWFVGHHIRGLHFGAHDFGRPCKSLPSPDRSKCPAGQEKAEVTSTALKTGFNLESVVVTEAAMRVYQNGELIGETEMPRILTDCSGQMLEFGSVRMAVQDLTFFPRELTTSEMQQMYSLGMTLGAISNGRIPNYFLPTMVDEINSETARKFADTEKQLIEATEKLVVGQVLTGVSAPYVRPAYPMHMVQPKPGCVPSANTRCYIIEGVTNSYTIDANIGKGFVDLMPGPAFGMTPGERLRMDYGEKRRHIYDYKTFPSTKGGSHSYSFWAKYIETGKGGGYLFCHHEHNNTMAALIRPFFRGQSREMRPYSGPEYGYNEETGDFDIPGNGHPKAYGPLLDIDKGEESPLRHFVFTFDAIENKVCSYQDGSEMACVDWASVADSDQPVKPAHYIGLGHRGPGALDYVGDLQQFRIYNGTALTASEVRTVAFESRDPITNDFLRECMVPSDLIADSGSWQDLYGHDCAWYENQRTVLSSICASTVVREQCKIACGLAPPCYGVQEEWEEASVWKRVMWFPVEKSSICTTKETTRESATERCRANPDPFAGRDRSGDATESYDQLFGVDPPNDGTDYIDVTNCDLLYDRIDPTCTFDLGVTDDDTMIRYGATVGDDWNTWFGNHLVTTQKYTLSFWMRPIRTDQAFNPWAIFYASLSPPRLLAALVGTEMRLFNPCSIEPGKETQETQDDNFVLLDFPVDEWTMFSFIFAGDGDESMGENNFATVINSKYARKPKALGRWCIPSWGDGSRRFIEAVSAHGVLMSPMRVRAGVVPVSQLQTEYYEGKVEYALRRGPRIPAMERYELLELEPEPYASAGYLIAPPIVLQQRASPSKECQTKLGTAALGIAKEDVVSGPACTAPYECNNDIKEKGMFTCRDDNTSPVKHFGKSAKAVNGDDYFWEFLTSITDVPILVRDKQQYRTDQFIDMQTTQLRVVFLVVAPKVGMITLVEVSASFDSTVSVESEVHHLQAVEGNQENSYLFSFGVHLVCVVLVSYYGMTCFTRGDASNYEGMLFSLLGICAALYQVVAVYYMWMSKQFYHALMSDIRAVPWVSPKPGETVEETAEFFFEKLDVVYQYISNMNYMRYASVFVALLALACTFVSTKTHPRIALLVSVVAHCYDDLFHFALLWTVIYSSFGILSTVIFGSRYESFNNMKETLFTTQLDMMIGGLEYVPEGFSQDPLLVIYIGLFFMVLFFFMLNFLLSIVVEAYLGVKKQIEDQETEQNFIFDVGAILRVMFMRSIGQWPSPESISERLSQCSSLMTINVETLGTVDESWSRPSRIGFVKYYERYDFLAPRKARENIQTFDHAVDALERRFAVVVGQPVPTMQERMSHTKKQKPEKFDTRFLRIEKKLNWLLENIGVPGGQQMIARIDEDIVDTKRSERGTMMPSQATESLLADSSTAKVARNYLVV